MRKIPPSIPGQTEGASDATLHSKIAICEISPNKNERYSLVLSVPSEKGIFFNIFKYSGFLQNLYRIIFNYISFFTFPSAPYRIFFLLLPWLPCHFYLVVIEQQQEGLHSLKWISIFFPIELNMIVVTIFLLILKLKGKFSS